MKKLLLTAIFAVRLLRAKREGKQMLLDIGDKFGALDMSDHHWCNQGVYLYNDALRRVARLFRSTKRLPLP